MPFRGDGHPGGDAVGVPRAVIDASPGSALMRASACLLDTGIGQLGPHAVVVAPPG